MRRFLSLIICVGLLFTFVTPINAYYTNMPASIVIGQQDFVSGSANQGASANANTVRQPGGVAYQESSGKLLISDQLNNRILIFNHIPTSNNASADVVIGQTNFTNTSANQGGSTGSNTLSNPTMIYIQGDRLFVSDKNNSRVLIFNTIPTQNNVSADVVVGQPDFTSSSANQGGGTVAAANTLKNPLAVFSDGQKLFVSDEGNHRVLIYNSIPTTNNASADVVVGQTNFTNTSANQGGTPGPNTVQNPSGLIVVNGRLILGDNVNHRVLIWNSIPSQNNTSADIVLGEVNFTNNNSQGTSGENNLRRPISVATDGKRLFIVCNFSARIVIHNTIPTSTAAFHDIAIGQTDLINNVPGLTQTTMHDPLQIAVGANKLFVTDSTNNRVLIYNNVISTPAMNINSPTIQPESKIRIAGNISLGERTRYTMQRVRASINGEQESNVTYLDGGRDNGPGNLLYEFYNDFLPTVNGGSPNNYTAAFTAMSRNGDEDKVFYFTPFSLDQITVESFPTLTFTVNQTFRDQLRNNLVKYQIWYKPTSAKASAGAESWKLYLDNILTSQENSGKIVVKGTTKLLKGKYQFQVKAINVMNHEQQSNYLNLTIKK